MKAFVRKIRSIKKRELIKNAVRKIRSVKKREWIKNAAGTCATAWALRYGQISHTPEPGPSNQHIERLNPSHKVIIMDDDNQFSSENQSVEKSPGVKLGSGINIISKKGNQQPNKDSEPLKYTLETYREESKLLTAQKAELPYSQEELEALGLVGEVNKEVTLAVGLSVPSSSHPALAVHEKNWNRFKSHPREIEKRMQQWKQFLWEQVQ